MTYKQLGYLSVAIVMVVTMIVGAVAVAQPNQSASASPNNQGDQPRTITVSGTGTVSAAPDIAYLSVGVNVANEDVTAAVEDANARIDAVTAALTDAGVAPEDIRTEYYNIYQDYNYTNDSAEPQPIFRVNIMLNVTVRDIENVGALLSTALSQGANAVNGISFSIADRAALETEARKLALANARTKADELAAELSVSIVAPERVEEYQQGGVFFAEDAASGRGGGADVAISTGTLSVSLTLNVTYSFE